MWWCCRARVSCKPPANFQFLPTFAGSNRNWPSRYVTSLVSLNLSMYIHKKYLYFCSIWGCYWTFCVYSEEAYNDCQPVNSLRFNTASGGT